MKKYFELKRQWVKENWLGLLLVKLIGLLSFLPIVLTGKGLFASDQLSSPSWKFYFDSLKKGVVPLWNSLSLAGMPTFDAGFGDAGYPIFILMGMLLPMSIFITWMFILHTLLAGVGAYYLVNRYFGLSRTLSTGLAVAYMLNTNFISHIHAGHTGKFYVMSWLPFALYFLLQSLRAGAHWRYALGLCVTMVIFLLTNHLQLTYFVLMGFFLVYAYKTFLLIKTKKNGAAALTAARFWVPIFLGIGIAFFMFWPTKQWTEKYGVRGSQAKMGYEHATSWSMHPEEAFSLIVPEFAGINERYWGRNPFKLNSEYPGISILFLGILGLVLFRRAKEGWFWLWGGIGLLSIIFGLGAHTFFFQLFYSFIPGIKNFRAPSMILFWLATSLLVMSADALSRLTGPNRKVSPEQSSLWDKRLMQFGFGFAGFLFLIGLAPTFFYSIWDMVFGGESFQNLANRVNDQSAFAFGALKNGVLLAVLVVGARKWLINTNDARRFGALFLVVTCLDLYSTNSNFLKPNNYEAALAKDQTINYLQNDKSNFRIYGLPGAYERWRMQYHGFEVIDGFTDNEYRLFREYRAGQSGDYQNNPNLMAGLKQNQDGTISGSTFLDILNVKYLAFRDPNSGQMGIAENASALPRAWFVSNTESIPEAQVLERMKDLNFNPRQTAFVSNSTEPSLTGNSITDTTSPNAAEVKLESKNYNDSKWSVKSTVPGIMVLSELWFPHWHATVDGKESELLRVNYALQGVRLTAGEHIVEYTYRSPWLTFSKMVGLISLALLIPYLVLLKWVSRKLETANT